MENSPIANVTRQMTCKTVKKNPFQQLSNVVKALVTTLRVVNKALRKVYKGLTLSLLFVWSVVLKPPVASVKIMLIYDAHQSIICVHRFKGHRPASAWDSCLEGQTGDPCDEGPLPLAGYSGRLT